MPDLVPLIRPVRLLPSAASFAVAYTFGLLLTTVNAIPSADSPSFAFTSFYDDRTNRIELLVGGFLLAASAPCFAWFVSVLARRTATADRTALPPPVGAALFGSATGTAAVALGLVAGELSLRGIAQPSAELERWLAELGYVLLLLPAMAGAALVVLTSSRALKESALVPRWLAYLGIPLAAWLAAAIAIALLTATPYALLPLPAWLVAVAVFGDARGTTSSN